MNDEQRIVIDPDVLVGKPTVRGTRIAVDFVLELLAQGWTEAEVLRNYPTLTSEDVRACLRYASRVLKLGRVYPIDKVGA
jgi:uncharacterized protein (DUF433 family)